MPRKLSSIAPDWWDYTTLDDNIIQAAARLTPEKMLRLSRPGFKVIFYDTLEDFYLAEALEYVVENYFEAGPREPEHLLRREARGGLDDVVVERGVIPPVGGDGAEFAWHGSE